VVIVAGGGGPAANALADVDDDAFVIAADSGIDHALRLGLRVDLAVGDMDSVSRDGLATAEAAGAQIERHPPAKDQTDLELALDRAFDLDAGRILVLGSDGGRLDHLLASVSLLALDRYAPVPIEAHLGTTRVTVVRTAATLRGRPGDVVSLVPVHGSAIGVTTEGLLYPLVDEALAAGTTRGVSNEMVEPTAHVRLRRGVLLALQPTG